MNITEQERIEIDKLILKYDLETVDDETWYSLEENPLVKDIESLGSSGLFIGKQWYNVIFINGLEMSIYS